MVANKIWGCKLGASGLGKDLMVGLVKTVIKIRVR
jgi:hypothetical protein